MSQPQLDYALLRRKRSRFMSTALFLVRIHAALCLCISVIVFWYYLSYVLVGILVKGAARARMISPTC